MIMAIKYVAIVIFGYLLGCLSFARILAKVKKQSILAMGSGNPGSMNMLRTYGAMYAFMTLLFDALKAAIPAIVGYYLLGGDAAGLYAITGLYLGGTAAILGHIYPVFYGFKGGKGIACTMGLFAVVNPLAFVVIFILFFIFFYFVKIGSLATLLFVYVFSIFETIYSIVNQRYDWWIWLILLFIVFIDTYAHRQNIKRILSNTERLTSFKEGVKKDIETIKNLREQKIVKMETKAGKIENKYNKKKEYKELSIERKTARIERKKQNKVDQVERKLARIQRKYDRKVAKIKRIEKEIVQFYKSINSVKAELEYEKGESKKKSKIQNDASSINLSVESVANSDVSNKDEQNTQ